MLVLRGPAPNPDPGPFYAFLIIFCLSRMGAPLWIATWRAAKMQKSSSKSAPGQDLAQNCRFQTFPKEVLIGTWRAAKMPKIELQKGSWPGFCPKGHFPMISRRTFFYSDLEASKRLLVRIWFKLVVFHAFPKTICLIAKSTKGVLARIWPKMAVSRDSDDKICLSPHPIECLLVSFSALGTTLKHTKILSA